MKIFITSGRTKISIDRVSSITNMSKDTFGFKSADVFYLYSKVAAKKITFFYG